MLSLYRISRYLMSYIAVLYAFDSCNQGSDYVLKMGKVSKIMIVNNDEKALAALSLRLTQAGHEVIMISSGESALVHVKEEDFDLVYCDLNMPGMNGLEVAKLVQSAKPGLKIVLYSCHEGELDDEIIFWSADKVKLVDEPCAVDEIAAFTDHLLNQDITHDPSSRD